MCRPKSNNLAMTSVIDFEARAFGELSRVVEITFSPCVLSPAWMQVVEPRLEPAAEMNPGWMHQSFLNRPGMLFIYKAWAAAGVSNLAGPRKARIRPGVAGRGAFGA